jgi:hypothetical protein
MQVCAAQQRFDRAPAASYDFKDEAAHRGGVFISVAVL